MIFSLALFALTLSSASAATFDYGNVLTWSAKAPTCGSSLRQSPINLSQKAGAPEAGYMKMVSSTVAKPLVDYTSWMKNGVEGDMEVGEHEIKVDVSKSKFSVKYGGNTYSTKQFHFHTPSEHRIDDKHFPMDGHFVSALADGSGYLVVGVFFDIEEGAESELVGTLIEALEEEEKEVSLNLKDFFHEEVGDFVGDFSVYLGSLTTPPCNETVQWVHYRKPVKMSVEQWYAMKDRLTFSSRLVQGRGPSARVTGSPDTFKWGYSGNNGPAMWASVFPTCGGTKQSPVDVANGKGKFVTLTSGKIHTSHWGHFKHVSITRGEHNIDIEFEKKDEKTGKTHKCKRHNGEEEVSPESEYAGTKYELKGIHVHTVSEHRVNGTFYPIEAHFVHKTADAKNIMVVGVFFDVAMEKETESSFEFEEIAAFFDGQNKEGKVDVNLKPIAQLIASSEVYSYDGSLTTPPCTEGVKWNVVKKPLKISLEHYKSIAQTFNSRPIIPRM
eukprot:Partr_v1_DN27562_c0_g1_i3_m30668 putative Carbonic AnHydrase